VLIPSGKVQRARRLDGDGSVEDGEAPLKGNDWMHNLRHHPVGQSGEERPCVPCQVVPGFAKGCVKERRPYAEKGKWRL